MNHMNYWFLLKNELFLFSSGAQWNPAFPVVRGERAPVYDQDPDPTSDWSPEEVRRVRGPHAVDDRPSGSLLHP